MAVTVQLTLGQLLDAICTLPERERIILRDALDYDLSRAEIRRRFGEALWEIWGANRNFAEEEVMADVERAIREVRAARRSACGD